MVSGKILRVVGMREGGQRWGGGGSDRREGRRRRRMTISWC
jgi:hypothetical protein